MKWIWTAILATSSVASVQRVSAQESVRVTNRLARISRNEPPQIRDAHRLFDRARPYEGNARENTLLCRVRIPRTRRFDGALPRGPISRNFGAPDLLAVMRLPSGTVRIVGPEDRYVATFSVPGVTLAAGQRIGIHAEDRDTFRNDNIGDAVGVFRSAFPVEITGMSFDAECRRLDPAIAEQRLPGIFRRVDRELRQTENVHVDLTGSDLDGPEPALRRATSHLYDAAALVGWGHPAVRERNQTIQQRRQAYANALQGALHTLEASLPAFGQPTRIEGTPFTATVTETRCDYADLETLRAALRYDEPRACAIRLELTTDRRSAFRVQARTLGTDQVGAARASLREDGDSYLRYERERLQPGETHVLWVMASEPSPTLLRLQARGRTTFLRLR